jgi:tyrosinase
MAGSMVYRLPVGDRTAAHMASFIQAMQALQAISDNRGYNYIAGFHGAPGNYCWHHQVNPRTPLQARLFLPWHRGYLWWLEQALQDHVEDVAIPWWDWTRERSIPVAYRPARVDGQINPLSGSRMSVPSARPPLNRRTRRAPGRTPGVVLPAATEIEDLLNDTDWASFSDRLESYHDEVHVWVGGDMEDIATAAFDSVFFAHHAMVDRIWYLWQVRHGDGGIPRDLLPLSLEPFGKTFADVLDAQRLGYEYAASATQLSLSTSSSSGTGSGG